jgi:hypothetical protein
LDEFETQTSQTSSHFFSIPSNPCVLEITEQALNIRVSKVALRESIAVRGRPKTDGVYS